MDKISPCASAGEEKYGLITHVSNSQNFLEGWLCFLYLDYTKLYMIFGVDVSIIN